MPLEHFRLSFNQPIDPFTLFINDNQQFLSLLFAECG
jgi:hypothetical protein